MLSKHGPSKMSRVLHGRFFTVNGLFRHINLYKTKEGNIIPKHMTFQPNKMTHYPLQTIFLQQMLKAT